MKTELQKTGIEEFLPKLSTKGRHYFEREVMDQWSNDKDLLKFELRSISNKDLDKILHYLKKVAKGIKNSWNASIVIEDYLNLQSDEDVPENRVAKTVQGFYSVLEMFILSQENKLFFQQSSDGCFVPYLVTSIRYYPPVRHKDYTSPAHVDVGMKYIYMMENETTSSTFYMEDIKGLKVIEILRNKGLITCTSERLEQYEKEMKLYNTFRNDIGKQFLGQGFAFSGIRDRWSNRDTKIPLGIDGRPTKVVIDDYFAEHEDEDKSFTAKTTTQFSDDVEEGQEEDFFTIPIHPYLYCYDLLNYRDVKVNTRYLTEYQYKPELIEKLILPQEHKDLIQILTEGTADIVDDIIEGKTGGIIVVATGPPGTGKTLTAEVYSEVIKKPLYVVQSSQLGVDVDALEEQLKSILRRAQRWEAILLLDEADVYVHERGDDLIQNAVVGVFLRVLEYYKGVLFLTSNRTTLIDDAILSRATAHIRYEIPTPEDAIKIWLMISESFKIDLPKAEINRIVKKYSTLSGRDIRSVLKLSRLLANRKKQKVNLKMVDFVVKFQDLNLVTDKGK